MIFSGNSSEVLQVKDASRGNLANVELSRSCGSANQSWIFRPGPLKDGVKTYVISSVKTGKVLDVQGYSRKNRANVQQFAYYGTNNQRWKLIPAADGFYRIISLHSDKCLSMENYGTGDADNAVQYDCVSGDHQLWRLEKNSSYKVYQIISQKSGNALDVDGKNPSDGANVQQFKPHDGDNQLWTLWPEGIYEGVQSYVIISFLSGRALDVDGKSLSDGANVQQFKYHGGENQRWKLISHDNKAYNIVAVHSGKCLDASSFGRENGANVRQYECSGSESQLWRLSVKKMKEIELIPFQTNTLFH